MKVKELIKILKKYDPEIMVCIPGYEGGIADIAANGVILSKIHLNVNKEWWNGKHEEADDGTDEAIIIKGE